MMNLIDISSWQAGIDLPTLFAQNPALDGVIVKLTQGTGYVNPCAKAWIDWLRSNGKPFGTYHYLDGSAIEAEARHYASQAKAYPGGIPALDYEDAALRRGTGYLLGVLDEVYRLIGVKPLVYCSQSVIEEQDFSAIAAAGYRLWVAQYADMLPVQGFVENPWHKGSPAPFDRFTMRQYTCCGRLKGWVAPDSNLDFDLFYGDAADWAALAGVPASDTPAEPKGPDPEVVAEVLDGKYGIGAERTQALTAAGYDAAAVQRKIDELYGVAVNCKKSIAGNGEYVDDICRIVETIP